MFAKADIAMIAAGFSPSASDPDLGTRARQELHSLANLAIADSLAEVEKRRT